MFVVASALIAAVTMLPPGGEHCRRAGKFVVHEWGTFTGISGSDGVQLEFRPLADNDLPEFVFDRARWFGQDFVRPVLGKGDTSAMQRMETPVIYFYTEKEQTVRVRVDFPQGLLTEFYPPVWAAGPEYQAGVAAPLSGSFLDWGTVALFPGPSLKDVTPSRIEFGRPGLPDTKGNHYGHARDTDAAYVRVGTPEADHYEKFLFYRGLGNFRLPVSVQATDEGRYQLTNAGKDPLATVFFFQKSADAGENGIRFAEFRNVAGRLQITPPRQPSSVAAVGEAMVRSLVGAGLFEREARAMVETWRSSWLGEVGTRIFYVVPQRVTDELLPLSIEPKPDELVRVLIGRVEVLSPTQERALGSLLKTIKKGDAEGISAAMEALGPYGRFAEPALRRAAAVSGDGECMSRADMLLDALAARN